MKRVIIPRLEALDQASIEYAGDMLENEGKREALDTLNWPREFPYRPITTFSLGYSSTALYIKYDVHGSMLRAIYMRDQEPVYEDSCVEFFCQRPGSDHYMNFAFNCIGAYALQNISVNVAVVVRALLPWAAEHRILTDFFCAAVFFPLGWLCFARRSGKDEEININRIWMMLLTVGVVLLVDILVKIAALPGLSDGVMLRISMTCSDILALLLQYSSFRAGKLEKEKLRTEALLQAEQEQYRLSRETIELVNMKCHDLKHRLAQIRAEGGGAEQLKDVEEAVLFYENVAKTGNDALDSVLTQKSLSCEKHGIAFTYMADGAGLEAMQPSDVWSLLGNALDNAIESCAQEEDPQKRIVFLNIGAKDGLLRIRVENYCSRPVRFAEGLPVTTKADRQNHGIGVRSIRYIAQKYGGNAVFSAEDGFFRLSVLIPLEKSLQIA